MNDTATRLLRMRGIFLVMTFFLVMLPTLPIQTEFNHIVIPDILLAITFSWVMQRPDIIGPILITITFLFADFILQRPPGLWTLIILLAGMFLHRQSAKFKEIFFIYEWATVSVVIILCYCLQHIIMEFTFLISYDPKLIIIQAITTMLLYPICAWLFRPMLKVRSLNIEKKQVARFSE